MYKKVCVFVYIIQSTTDSPRETVPAAPPRPPTSVFSSAGEDDMSEDNEFVVNCDTIEVGMVVACFLQCYGDEEPQIGKVVALERDLKSVVIEWMTGTYSQPWVLYKYRKQGIYTTWRETIPITSVLFPLELTTSSRIPSALKLELQNAYEQIRKI